MSYKARREDSGEIIDVTFEQVMAQSGGFITLPDGALARRCVYLEPQEQRSSKREKVQAEIVSDTLGVTADSVQEYRENAKQYGYSVEFSPEPGCEHFYQARFPSRAEYNRYAKFRGLCDKNSKNGSGATLSPAQFEQAKQRLLSAAG